jgi:hypothetical protein
VEGRQERTKGTEDQVTTTWPKLVSAIPTGGYRLRLVYSDGFTGEVDFTDILSRGGIFAFMRDPQRFQSVRVAHGGTALQWIDDEGDEIDFDGHAQRMKAEANAVAAAK